VKKHLTLALSLAGMALSLSACAAATPPPGASATEAPATPAPTVSATTGWKLNPQRGAERIKAAGLEVLNTEGAAEHFHAHLDVFVDGKAVAVPADIGFSFDADNKPDGISALHTHDESGIVHIEAPVAGDNYTLGQLLTEWGVLDGTDKTPGSEHSGTDGWTVTVNGKKQAGRINDVVLKAHNEVVLSYGTSPAPVPSTFQFPEGL